MRMSDGVEWAAHCCTMLAVLPEGECLPAARLAEYNELPTAYLAKHLQALTAAGVTESVPGPRGGFRLARPAAETTLLSIVQAIEGHAPAFRCTEIRQRGPGAIAGSPAYCEPCGIAAAMGRAEAAWRAELAATTVADLLGHLIETAPPELLAKGAEWVQTVRINRRTRT